MEKQAAGFLIGIVGLFFAAYPQDSICTYLWRDCDLDTCFNRTQLVEGQALRVPENVVRISREGLRLCLDAVELDEPVDIILSWIFPEAWFRAARIRKAIYVIMRLPRTIQIHY
ncbi:MAG: hypothetical protein GF350_16005 [Chitinivibrionales bacterium]|nr:hypothetical protein [Chitinivibrionales bacterium]